jgi:hypothetical protein
MQCTSCGTPLSTGMTNCPTCNRPVSYNSHPDEIPQRPQIFSAMNITLLALIVLFLISGGGGFAYYAQDIHPNEMNAQATTVAQTVLQAQAQNTALAHLQLSATAAALTPQQIYTQATSGTPVINDPLTSTAGNTWYQYGTPSNGCYYSGRAYHLKFARQGAFSCTAFNSFFHGLAFQVQVTILEGDAAGLLFDINNGNSNAYLFEISPTGSYGLYVFKFGVPTVLSSGTSTTFYGGYDRSNLLTTIDDNGQIYLFANKQPIAHVFDSTYNSGQIALVGETSTNFIDVEFNNVQVWSS